ncbi:MAG: response regulator transcription factor [Phycisphaerae bacterium]
MAETVLIIEDDPSLLRGLADNLRFEGYATLTAGDGELGLQLATDKRPDLILLDIMLPKVNGYEICRRLRAQNLDMPILMLTAKGQEPDIVLGLNLGADDYITKPFALKPLLARINAFLRRRRTPPEKSLQFGPFTLDLAAHKLLKHIAAQHRSEEIELTPKEFSLLALLARRPGRAFTRDEILKHVWGFDVFITTRSVDRCITTLRSKIEPAPAAPTFIHTLREIGYRFDPPS